MRKFLFLLVFALAGCDGDGGGGVKEEPTADQHPPNIFNLKLTPDAVEYMADGGSTQVTANFGYNDAGLDVLALKVAMPDGSVFSVPIDGPIDSYVGKLVEQFAIATDEVGEVEMEFWLVDSKGVTSPRLSAGVLVYGDVDEWFERMSDIPQPLNAVARWWGDSKFIAVGDHGTILTSPDGIAWTARDSGTDVALYDVACDPYACYAVGDSGTMLRSWDGETWEETWDGTENISLRSISSNPLLRYVGGSDLDDDTSFMMRYVPATDTWKTIDALAPGGSSITGIATSFGWPPAVHVATQTVMFPTPGAILTSADGLTWIRVAISAQNEETYSLLYDGERFWAGGTWGRIYASPDGVNWTTLQTPAQNAAFTAMAWNGSVLVAHGTFDDFIPASHYGVVTADSGATWETFVIGVDFESHGLAYADGRFVSVGRTTPDGEGAIFSTR